ncbi:unnamed protein product [Moneuplotes crassus]|uniref:Uncharacterized protein n=1 Tax=Euplotes crassus TaxID=5936 RepID=A0AAD2D5F6_EUPCR|nr:unnamed protein product [Moneuplotes crassus]
MSDYPEYDQYPYEEVDHRFSLHSGTDIRLTNNQMNPESMENVNHEITQEDHGFYHGRPTDAAPSRVPGLKLGNNFVQNYNEREEQIFQNLPETNQNNSSAPGSKSLRDRMDALDEMHPIGTEVDEGSENVEADEREGNGDYIQRQISSDKEGFSDINEDSAQANYYNQIEVERRMDRMNLNPPMNGIAHRPQNLSNSNMNPMQTPSRRGDDSFQNMDDYQSQAPGQYMNESNDPQTDHLIMQYESVLQSVNREFQKLLEKNRQTEEDFSVMRSELEKTQIALEQEQANLATKMNDEKRLQMIQLEKNEVENENKNLRMHLGQRDDEIERLQNRIIQLEHEASQIPSLRAQLDELQNRNHQKESTTREKEESILKTESELRNMERVEGILKAEIEELLEKRKGLEEINQALKNQVCECNITLRQMASQLDSTKRENMALENNIEIFKKSEEQLREENSSLKELVNNIEIERIHFRATCELLQRELSFVKKENASYLASENRILNFAKPKNDVHNYPSQIPEVSPASRSPLSSFQHLLKNNEMGSGPPSRSEPNFGGSFQPPAQENMPTMLGGMNFDHAQQAPSPANNIPSNMGGQMPAGSPSKRKLPMHLASSITFAADEGSDQYYRKNQAPSPSMGQGFNSPQNSVAGIPSIPNLPIAGMPTPKDPRPGGNPGQFPQGVQGPPHLGTGMIPGSQGPPIQLNSQQKFQQIQILENSLLSFQMDKDRLTAELNKIPESHSKSHHQQQRKAELERELYIADKNINTVKLKLRDIKR